MIKFLDLGRQYQQDRDAYLDLADRVYSSGRVINGEYCARLEDSLRARTGRKHCILTGSCTDALAFTGAALKTFEINVYLFPSVSFPATDNGTLRDIGESFRHVIYVDVDETGTIDLNALEEQLELLDTSYRIIVVWVNLYGHTVNYTKMQNLSAKFPHVDFVEDAAQSFGASWKNIPSGAMGIASCISFDPTKNLNAYGLGGAVLTDNKELADTVDLYRRPHTVSWTNYGYNSQINEVDAAMLWWKLENRFDVWQARRTEIANYYINNLDVECIKPDTDCTSAWHKFVILHPERDKLASELHYQGVETKIHYPLTLNQTENHITSRCLSLPIYPELSDSEVETVVSVVNRTAKQVS